jgi:hypothetical protein
MAVRKKRMPLDGCMSCGGPCTTPCVGNHGGHYLGCDSGCRFKTAAEIEEMCRPTAARLADRLAAIADDRHFASDPTLLEETIAHLRRSCP